MTTLKTQTQQLKEGGFNPVKVKIGKKKKLYNYKRGFDDNEILGQFGVEPIDTSNFETVYDSYKFEYRKFKDVYATIKEAEERDDRSL